MRPLIFLFLFLCTAAVFAQAPAGDPYSSLPFLIGDWVADGPTSAGSGRLGGKFEIAPPGKPEEFKTYLEWTAKRKAS